MDGFEVRIGDVCVDLCRGDVAVTQEGLYATQVGAIHQKVSRKAVTQRVWTDVLGYAS